MSDLKITICAIAKNEEKYIEDWIKYHYELGFDSITIYDNNVPEKYGEVEKLVYNSKKLTDDMKSNTKIIDATGKSGFQIKAYNEHYKRGDFDWCAFIDIDEFITLYKWKNIHEMLNDKTFSDTDAIFLIWDTISDDDIVDVPDDYVYNGKLAKDIDDPDEREAAAAEWQQIPVYKRLFKSTLTYDTAAHKMLIRGGLRLSLLEVHHYITDQYIIAKYPSGDRKRYVPKYHASSVDMYRKNFAYANIRHYRTKTIREYLHQKYLNQSSACNNLTRTLFVDDYFFLINKRTPEKIAYYEKHHRPITCNLLKSTSYYDPKKNNSELCYIPYNSKKFGIPFVLNISELKKHYHQIDKFVII